MHDRRQRLPGIESRCDPIELDKALLMKLLSWNIRHGGGKRTHEIVSAICNHDPDVVALSEYRTAPGVSLYRMLAGEGWTHVESTTPSGRDNGICVVSRTPLQRRPSPPVPPENAVRWLDADLPAFGFGVGVLHIVGSAPKLNERRGDAKARFWEAVLSTAQTRHDTPFIFIGDFNTGAHCIDEAGATFFCAEHFGRMTALGWTDLWRAFNTNATEYTWYSKRKGGAWERIPFRSCVCVPRTAAACR